MGFPINSADDDIFFNYIKDGSKGYFASYRDDSYGEKDIYMVTRPKMSSSMLVMRGKVFEKGTKKPISATITLVNKANGETEQVANSQASSGRYSSVISFKKTYAVTVSARGYISTNDEFTVDERPEVFDVSRTYMLDKAPEEPVVDTAAKPAEPVAVVEKPVEKAPEPVVVKEEKPEPVAAKPAPVREPLPEEIRSFKNIYFDYKVNELPKKAKADLKAVKKYLISDPSYKIRVIGYADSIGPEAYNSQLSLKRAQAVAEYLKKLGVPESQVIVDGKGEINPLGDNGSKKGRSLNRRAELVPEK
ncbi:MAG: OmpA family protein, partial [Cytophagales bacterium]|nr:OmpA family protein [Cytophagales bacterium]